MYTSPIVLHLPTWLFCIGPSFSNSSQNSLLVSRIDGGDPDFVFAALDLSNPEAEDAVYDYMHDRTSDSGQMARCPNDDMAT